MPQREAGFGPPSLQAEQRTSGSPLKQAGFEPAPSLPSTRRASSTTTGSGGSFGNASAAAASAAIPAATRATAASTPFDTARSAAPASPLAASRTGLGGFTPVEILSKPRPLYTDDGRRARVEGEVTLEVLFAASGKTRVLRALSRLGHGLDESALRAAEEIRFRPAMREGRPEDTVATVRIDFRLAY